MPMMISGGGYTPRRPVMAFIDGGHLRSGVKEQTGFSEDKINFRSLAGFLQNAAGFGGVTPTLIRLYYYDAIIDAKDNHDKHDSQLKYFDKIDNMDLYEVRLGRMLPDNASSQKENKYKQKGVDVLMAIDMLTKAYQDQFEVAVFLGGDDDFLDLIKAVKDVGKNVVGVYFPEKASKRLVKAFDLRVPIDKATCDRFELFRPD